MGFPVVTTLIVLVNVAVFLRELAVAGSGRESGLEHWITALGVVPYDITHHVQPPPPAPHPEYLSIITALFVHAGFLHLGGNMLYLYIFGPAVEWLTGPVRFAVFYLLCGIVASLAHILVYPDSTVVAIGASGAIAGVLGAFILFFARDTIDAVLPIGCFPLFLQVPAFVLIGLWAVTQILLVQSENPKLGGVGYLEHVAGFAAGMLLVWFFKARDPRASVT